MPEKEESEEESEEEAEKRIEEMREKIREMQGMGGPDQMPAQMGPSPLMQRMASMGGGPQNKAMIEAVKGLRADMKEIKGYLRKIQEALEEK